MNDEPIAGYYQLLIAVFCSLNATESRYMYYYGPNHPLCRKIIMKKIEAQRKAGKISNETADKIKEEINTNGCSLETAAEALECDMKDVKSWIKSLAKLENL